VLRQVAEKVRDDGLIVFQEHDFTLRIASAWPPVPLLETCFRWITEATIVAAFNWIWETDCIKFFAPPNSRIHLHRCKCGREN
jgi:hypothetical protein